VESTLRRAYRKLGIRTRDDLAPLLALAERLRGDAA
jgi:DNA-binding CsgD family transcriptional regulator